MVPAGPTRVLVRVLVLRCVAACCSLHTHDFATRHDDVGEEIDQLHDEAAGFREEVKLLNDTVKHLHDKNAALETTVKEVRAQAYQHPARVPHTYHCVHKKRATRMLHPVGVCGCLSPKRRYGDLRPVPHCNVICTVTVRTVRPVRAHSCHTVAYENHREFLARGLGGGGGGG